MPSAYQAPRPTPASRALGLARAFAAADSHLASTPPSRLLPWSCLLCLFCPAPPTLLNSKHWRDPGLKLEASLLPRLVCSVISTSLTASHHMHTLLTRSGPSPAETLTLNSQTCFTLSLIFLSWTLLPAVLSQLMAIPFHKVLRPKPESALLPLLFSTSNLSAQAADSTWKYTQGPNTSHYTHCCHPGTSPTASPVEYCSQLLAAALLPTPPPVQRFSARDSANSARSGHISGRQIGEWGCYWHPVGGSQGCC